jgi:nucleoside-diphosphate-sugar epimerase
MKVLIAGCGYVGTELGLILAVAGHEVWGVRRDPSRLPAPIQPIAADLLDPGLTRVLPRVDAVVYTAAAGASSPEAYRAAYVDGPLNVLRALESSHAEVRRILFTSSTAVWGDAAGTWVDEETPTSPDGFRGELVLEGEDRLRESNVPSVSLRLGGIYGPERTRLLERVRAGEARCPEEGSPADRIWSNRIHRDDAAGALAHLLIRDDPHPVYVGVDDEPARLCDVYTFVAELLGEPVPPRGDDADRTRSNKRCSNRRLRASGYRLRYPTFREGYRSMIEGAQLGQRAASSSVEQELRTTEAKSGTSAKERNSPGS